MHQSVPVAQSQRRHNWDAASVGCHCLHRDLERISICLSEQFSVTTVFLLLLTAAPALATVDWMNWLLLLPAHHLGPVPQLESLHFWILSRCGCGQHFQLSAGTFNALVSNTSLCYCSLSCHDVVQLLAFSSLLNLFLQCLANVSFGLTMETFSVQLAVGCVFSLVVWTLFLELWARPAVPFHQDDHASARCTCVRSEREYTIGPFRSASVKHCWLLEQPRVDDRRHQDLPWNWCRCARCFHRRESLRQHDVLHRKLH